VEFFVWKLILVIVPGMKMIKMQLNIKIAGMCADSKTVWYLKFVSKVIIEC